MPKACFIVRAVVAGDLRDKFDHWYSSDHLPWACRIFQCEKAWRFWSEVDRDVHYAVYQFADMTALEAALARNEFKDLVADFDRSWPKGISRTWDKVTLAEEREP